MKTLVCTEPGKLCYTSQEKPLLTPGHAIISIKRIGVCGTDLHAFEGTQPYFTYPRVLGHELSGILEDADGAAGFKTGEAVTFVPYYSCGNCIACRTGKPNCCVQVQVCGVHIDGGMAEYLSVPSSSLVHGQNLGLDALALTEPLAIGAHGIRRAAVRPGEFVLVIGAGPIGLATMEFARIAGATVIGMDINEQRLRFCQATLKVPHTINALSPDVTAQLNAITSGDMPGVVIDATGNQKAINIAFRYMAHGGRYVMIGLQKGDICFSHPEFHKREATLMSSRNATLQDFEHVTGCIKAGLVTPGNYITHRVNFDDVKDEFAKWLDPGYGVIKAMIEL